MTHFGKLGEILRFLQIGRYFSAGRPLIFYGCALVLALGPSSLAAGELGKNDCGQCHPAQVQAFRRAAMALALSTGRDATVLKNHSDLHGRWRGYDYRIVATPRGFDYLVSNGSQTLSANVLYAVGNGSAGQTYILEYGGKWYEGRMSYYPRARGLDLTLGSPSLRPQNLIEALGKELNSDDRKSCLGCHTSGEAGVGASGGLSCESCHGEASAHAKSLGPGRQFIPMRDLKRLTTEEQLNLCGRCHRTWETVVSQSLKGINTIRFQPYRLTNSKCYSEKDRRIACTACHAPHEPLQRELPAYDPKCLACHGSGSKTVCRIALTNCVNCHMPKIELPGAHFAFTDHQIRIVPASNRLPD